MSRVLAIIAKMRDLGIPEASILAVVEVAEAATPKTSAAVRQARYRAKKNAANDAQTVTRYVTRDVTNVTLEPAPRVRVLCGEEVSIKNKTPNGVLQKDGSKSKGSRITGCWSPEDRDWQFAISELGSQAADRELAKFRDYWIGRAGAGGIKADWSATWRNWVRKAADDRKANQRAGPSAPREKPMGAAAAILQRDREKSRNERHYAETQPVVIDALPIASGAR